MKIAVLNMTTSGSTGKIMLQTAELARQYGHEVKTYSTHLFSVKYQKLPKAPNGHKYYSTYFENTIHFILARITGKNGLYSRFATRRLVRELKKYKPDIIHLHALHCFCINFPILFKFIKKHNVRVIWTFHDCWAFTGHCPHYDMVGCSKWKTGCYDCPRVREYPKVNKDVSKKMYGIKKDLFTGVKDLTVITPSKWLAMQVKESFLSDYPILVINNGIDLSVFKPIESDFRQKYDIKEKFIVLGVAFGWGIKKGLDVFIELANRLGQNYQVVLVGTEEFVDKQLPENIISIHKTQNQKELAEIYTVADVFVNPTREDTFPTVNIESLACGTPVITFNTGGSPEIIDETCGFVVEKEDIDGLIEKIDECYKHNFSQTACLTRARNYDMNDKFQEYIELYVR